MGAAQQWLGPFCALLGRIRPCSCSCHFRPYGCAISLPGAEVAAYSGLCECILKGSSRGKGTFAPRQSTQGYTVPFLYFFHLPVRPPCWHMRFLGSSFFFPPPLVYTVRFFVSPSSSLRLFFLELLPGFFPTPRNFMGVFFAIEPIDRQCRPFVVAFDSSFSFFLYVLNVPFYRLSLTFRY